MSHTLIGLVVASLAIVGTYFFLRNNKKKKEKVDNFVEDVKKKL